MYLGSTSNDMEPKKIKDEDDLYFRIHRDLIQGNPLRPKVFRQQGEDGFSCDWSRLSTPQQTRERAASPKDNGVIAMSAGGVRSIEALTIKHDPRPEEDGKPANPSHTLIKGIPYEPNTDNDRQRLTRIRESLSRVSRVVCHPD